MRDRLVGGRGCGGGGNGGWWRAATVAAAVVTSLLRGGRWLTVGVDEAGLELELVLVLCRLEEPNVNGNDAMTTVRQPG